MCSSRTLSSCNERAFAIYNPSDREQNISLKFSTIDLGGQVELYDCFAQSSAGTARDSFAIKVPPHGTRIYRAKAVERLERKVYEAETAWLSHYQELHRCDQTYTAFYFPKNEASCGYVAATLGYRPGNDLQWKHVFANKAGHRKMTIHYFSGENRTIRVDVNGVHAGTVDAKGKNNDWNTRRSVTIGIDLKKGDNTIRLWNDGAWLPDIDGMELE